MMFGLIREDNKFSFEKSFIILLLFATLLPRLDAIDNNAIRWFSLTTISSIYILKLILDRRFKFSFPIITNIIFLIFFSFLLFSLTYTANFNEGLISLNK